MGNCLKGCTNKEIISEESLAVIKFLVDLLKQHAASRDVFVTVRNDRQIQTIVHEIEKGTTRAYKLIEDGSMQENSGALQQYLLCLKKPLFPHHVQALALDEHSGVTPEMVARDMLGLLCQDLSERHKTLIGHVLDLLYAILKHSPTDELTGCTVPFSMLPIFFNFKAEQILRWRKVAIVFVEIIRLSPTYFNFSDVEQNANERNLENVEQHIANINHVVLQQRLLEMNYVLRRYLIRADHRGDAPSFEIFDSHRRSQQSLSNGLNLM